MKKIAMFGIALLLSLGMTAVDLIVVAVTADGVLVLGPWNVRGYPEETAEGVAWFRQALLSMGSDIVCMQEIGNQDDINVFLSKGEGFAFAAFENSADRMDNAVFFAAGIQIVDVRDPQGFQHPSQAVYFGYRGLDAMLITAHLSWTDTERRVKERDLLVQDVKRALDVDPDVIVAGDFNTTGRAGDTISGLAEALGLRILKMDNEGIGTTNAGKSYDFIFVSPDLDSEEALGQSHIVVFNGQEADIAKVVSDHRPVIARFRTDEKYGDCTTWPPKGLLSFSWDSSALAATTSACLSCLNALSSASYSDFHAVDGIGNVLAQRLVDGQPYVSREALDDVEGIGPAKMKTILDALCTN